MVNSNVKNEYYKLLKDIQFSVFFLEVVMDNSHKTDKTTVLNYDFRRFSDNLSSNIGLISFKYLNLNIEYFILGGNIKGSNRLWKYLEAENITNFDLLKGLNEVLTTLNNQINILIKLFKLSNINKETYIKEFDFKYFKNLSHS